MEKKCEIEMEGKKWEERERRNDIGNRKGRGNEGWRERGREKNVALKEKWKLSKL